MWCHSSFEGAASTGAAVNDPSIQQCNPEIKKISRLMKSLQEHDSIGAVETLQCICLNRKNIDNCR